MCISKSINVRDFVYVSYDVIGMVGAHHTNPLGISYA